MYNITIRFHDELNFFVTNEKKGETINCSFKGKRSIKDLIESLRVPHVEVDFIIINDISRDFSYLVKDGDRINVYPDVKRLEEIKSTGLIPVQESNITFILDVHLRKLCKRLRLFGFDTDYEENRDDRELSLISQEEGRILLTRYRQLLMHRNLSRGMYIRNTDPEKQLLEIFDRLDLRDFCRPFSRCIKCNGLMTKLKLNNEEMNYLAAELRGIKMCH